MTYNKKNILFFLSIFPFMQSILAADIDIRYNKMFHAGHPLVEHDCPTRNGSMTIQQWVKERSSEDLSPVSRIILRDNKIQDKGAAIIVDLIQQHIPSLKTLDLSYNPLSAQAGSIFVPLLLSPSFEYLILINTDAGSLEGREAIREALKDTISTKPPSQLSNGEDIEKAVERFCQKIIYIPERCLDYYKQSVPAEEIAYHELYFQS
ncbi:MAG: hypothetical protein FJX71_04215 [Alphaproteobacteria bacterium]|nr:hypothetical protein [Alphaproteobacteria bacterium]